MCVIACVRTRWDTLWQSFYVNEEDSVLQFWDDRTCQKHYEQGDLKGQLIIINFVQAATHDMTLVQPDGPTAAQ